MEKTIGISYSARTLGVNDSEKSRRIWRDATALDQYCSRFWWQTGQLTQLLPVLCSAGIRRGSFDWLRGVNHYRKVNWRPGEREINVAQAIDKAIPFDKEALANYLSVFGIWIAGFNYLNKEFGRAVTQDLSETLDNIASFYTEAVVVFDQAQTSFERGRDGGIGFWLLRLIDKSRNAAPSLHVEVAAYAYTRLTDIIDRQAIRSGNDPGVYEPVKNAIFSQAVRILEAVLLAKQHVVLDVGLGLAALSGRGEEYCTAERVHRLIDAMFDEDTHGMDKTTVEAIRRTIRETHDELAAEMAASPHVARPDILISCLERVRNLTPSLF